MISASISGFLVIKLQAISPHEQVGATGELFSRQTHVKRGKLNPLYFFSPLLKTMP